MATRGLNLIIILTLAKILQTFSNFRELPTIAYPAQHLSPSTYIWSTMKCALPTDHCSHPKREGLTAQPEGYPDPQNDSEACGPAVWNLSRKRHGPFSFSGYCQVSLIQGHLLGSKDLQNKEILRTRKDVKGGSHMELGYDGHKPVRWVERGGVDKIPEQN